MKEKQTQSSDICLHNKQFCMMDKAVLGALAILNVLIIGFCVTGSPSHALFAVSFHSASI